MTLRAWISKLWRKQAPPEPPPSGGLDEPIGRIIRSLFEQRNAVDYGEADPSREDAELSIRDAQRFVDAVESWLTAHG